MSSRPSLLSLLLIASPMFCQDDPLRLAAQLDAQGKCAEAEAHYQRALAQGPPSAALLNNLGNHHLVCGDADKARIYFEELLQRTPSHPNANLQLARMAADRKQGKEALRYLEHVQDGSAAVRLLRAEALYYAGRRDDAIRLLDIIGQEAGADERVRFALGVASARIGLYDRAEEAFNAVLAGRPDDFDVLFHLGRAAARAQHFDRARRALEAAVKLRPADPDALRELGLAFAALEDYSRAVYVLAQARQHAPRRPDILLPLAQAAEYAGYFGDSALAYDEYLRLRPDDDAARRDHGRVCGHTGVRLEEGLKELRWYIEKHPKDPAGHFSLAQFTWKTDPDAALAQLATALRLDPSFVPAHYARAWLLHRVGRIAESLPHLEAVARLQPQNVRGLDQLGVTYLSLEQSDKAEGVLRKALALAPDDPEVLMHLGRALMALDRAEEAQPYLARFRKLRPRNTPAPRREPGMIALATMPEAERRRREIERLRRDAQNHPGNPELQLHLAGLLLADGQTAQATAAYGELLTRNADAAMWQRAGRTLSAAGEHELARTFLERAAAADPQANLDLAITLFSSLGAGQALQALDKVPESGRQGDYFLMKARILDAAGRAAEADKTLQEALRRPSTRGDVALQAAWLLVSRKRLPDAMQVLRRATAADPDSPELLLGQAVVLALMDRVQEAEETLTGIERRWPEWHLAYRVHGVLLGRARRPDEARRKLQTARALGSTDSAGCQRLESILAGACR